jgi:ferrous-iron efflux pump FieF
MDIKQKASLFAICSAFILAGSKFSVGLLSGSMAVASSGLDSLLDVFMSAMNFLAIRKAAQPPDLTHPYGHGKAENLAAVGQSFVILFTGSFIIFKAAEKYFLKEGIAYSVLDLGVMALSLLFSFIISTTLRKVGRKTDSDALKADALHYTSDLYSNSAAILAIILAYYTGQVSFDTLFAVIVGLIIIFSALKILKSGIVGLMDSRIPEAMEASLIKIITNSPYPVAGYHNLRTRFSGSRKYVDFHLLICRKLNVGEAHEEANKMEADLKSKVSGIDIVIHIEPCSFDCELTEATCSVVLNREGKGFVPPKGQSQTYSA